MDFRSRSFDRFSLPYRYSYSCTSTPVIIVVVWPLYVSIYIGVLHAVVHIYKYNYYVRIATGVLEVLNMHPPGSASYIIIIPRGVAAGGVR